MIGSAGMSHETRMVMNMVLPPLTICLIGSTRHESAVSLSGTRPGFQSGRATDFVFRGPVLEQQTARAYMPFGSKISTGSRGLACPSEPGGRQLQRNHPELPALRCLRSLQ